MRNEGDEKAYRQATFFRCSTDLELFASLYFPHYCRLPFSELHRERFENAQIGSRGIRRVRAAPRGYAKSTFAAVIEPIHDICYCLEKFLIFLSCTEDQAIAKLKDIRAELLVNDNLVNDYGIHFPAKKVASSEFTVFVGDHEIHLKAVGSGTEIRGIRFREQRPSKIVCDDYEDSDVATSEVMRNKAQDYFFEVVSKIGDTETNIDVVGTVLHKEALIPKLLSNPAYNGKLYKSVNSWADRQDLWNQWTKIYTNLDNDNRFKDAQTFYEENQEELLKGVSVLWPEKESYLYLMKELVEIGKRAFWKEKQNDPRGTEDNLFEKFHWYEERSDGLWIEETKTLIPWEDLQDECYAAIDPATGQTKPNQTKDTDFTCLLLGYKDPKGRLFVHRDYTKRTSPTKYIAEIFEYNNYYNFSKLAIETNLYRNLLLPNIIDEKKRREAKEKKKINISFYEVDQVENKHKRIYTLEPKVTHGWILFNKELSKTFIGQFEEFPNASHDDGCFVKGTLIATKKGNMNIEELKIGDEVLTPFGFKKIINFGSREAKVIHKYDLTGTEDHPIFTWKKGFVNLDALEYSMAPSNLNLMELLKWNYLKLLYLMEHNISSWDRKNIISASQIQMKDEKVLKDFMLRFGSFIIKGKLRKAISFIIKTAITLITVLKIWNVYRLKNMLKNIQQIQTKLKNHWKKQENQQKNGIDQTKEENGTLNMPKRFLKKSRLAIVNVLDVIRFISQNFLKDQCFVRHIAETDITLKQEKLQKKEPAKFAENNLKQSNTNKPEHAVKAVQTVYNLTVEEHGVYYANGLLVSNCDALEILWNLVNKRYKPSPLNQVAIGAR